MSARPDTIGRHLIRETLGVGGFATVYLADDPRLEALVAIKVLDGKWSADGDLRRRFIAEARVMRQLAAPGLVTVYDIGEHEDRPYFVMEHCDRGTLADRLDAIDRPLTVDEALTLAEAVTRPTASIHRAGVVHRDLKPGNYLIRRSRSETPTVAPPVLQPDEELVLADFGLAKAIQLDATRMSIAAGTPGYGAPEQFRGDPTVDARADVYALSAIIVSSLSNEEPRLVVGPDTRAFSEAALATTGPLAGELARGLSIDRSARHDDVQAWYRALVTARSAAPTTKKGRPRDRPPSSYEGSGGRSDDDPPQPAPSRRLAGRLSVLAAVLTLVVMLGVGSLAAGLISLPGPAVYGPDDGLPGDEAVFAADSDDPHMWTVNGREVARGRVISLTPAEAGTFEIEASSGFRSTSLEFVASEPIAAIRIAGPGQAPVGRSTRFSVDGAEGAEITWTIDGRTREGRTIELSPTRPGALELRASSSGGEEIRRVITAIEE